MIFNNNNNNNFLVKILVLRDYPESDKMLKPTAKSTRDNRKVQAQYSSLSIWRQTDGQSRSSFSRGHNWSKISNPKISLLFSVYHWIWFNLRTFLSQCPPFKFKQRRRRKRSCHLQPIVQSAFNLCMFILSIHEHVTFFTDLKKFMNLFPNRNLLCDFDIFH